MIDKSLTVESASPDMNLGRASHSRNFTTASAFFRQGMLTPKKPAESKAVASRKVTEFELTSSTTLQTLKTKPSKHRAGNAAVGKQTKKGKTAEEKPSDERVAKASEKKASSKQMNTQQPSGSKAKKARKTLKVQATDENTSLPWFGKRK